jgi:23S rRNA pseudouridine1911/1915/1917 synthase
MPSPLSIARLAPPATVTCRIVFEDESLVVVDKPSGLLATPTVDPTRPSVVTLLAARAPDDPLHAVHRLDRLASGLLVLAKTPDATRSLARQIAARTVRREYAVVVAGRFPDDRRTVAHPIGGRPAVTHLATEERLGTRATRLRCRLETGRTHQIRIHARVAGHPVLGDHVHGTPAPGDPPRLALHAATLAFVHPRTHARVTFESAWPDDLAPWLARLRQTSGELPTRPCPL